MIHFVAVNLPHIPKGNSNLATEGWIVIAALAAAFLFGRKNGKGGRR